MHAVQGSDPGAKDRDGCTPLYCAAAWNRPAAVKKLDELGCPSWVRSEEGRTPVHVAAEQGWVSLIDLLVRELRNKVDSRDAYQFTPLHSAANGGHVGTIQKLIHFQHDVDVRDYLGMCSRHELALNSCYQSGQQFSFCQLDCTILLNILLLCQVSAHCCVPVGSCCSGGRC